MFKLFRKKSKIIKSRGNKPQFVDFFGNPLKEGDVVESMRYDLGKCKIIKAEKGFIYESLESGEQMNWLKMIDASTSFQKVKKIEA